jgi:hypothetical protein
MNPSTQKKSLEERAAEVSPRWLGENVSPIQVGEVFLDASVVRPGDVLITMGTGLNAKAIQVLSNARYSHAAVWLPLAAGNVHMLAESDGDGVGFTPMLPTRFENTGSPPAFVRAYAVPGVTRYKLLRHPQIQNISPERLLAAAQKLQDEHFSRPYSHRSRLLDAYDMPAPLRELAKKAYDMVQKPDPIAGSFCSELVGLFFNEIGLPLFTEDRAPSSIAPKDLDAEGCLLEDVGGAFLMPDDFKGWTRRDPLLPESSERENFLPYAVSVTRRKHAVSDLLDSADLLFADFAQVGIKQMRNLQAGLEEISLISFRLWSHAGATEQTQRADLVASESLLLVHLIDAIEQQSLAYRGSTAVKVNLAWVPAFTELMGQYTKLYSELAQAASQSIEQYKAQNRSRGQAVVTALKNAAQLLRDVVAKANSQDASAMSLPPTKLDTLAQAHVAKTWDLALDAMSAAVTNPTSQTQPAAAHQVPAESDDGAREAEDASGDVEQPRP